MTSNKLDNNEYSSIRFSVLFHIAINSFFDKKMRSFLTVLGVVIGVSAVYFLVSFGVGIEKLVTKQVIGDKSLKAIEVTSPNSKIIKLNDTIANNIKKYAHVEQVGVQYSYPGILNLNGGEIDVVAYGVDTTYQNLSSLSVSYGRLLENHDKKSVLINTSALKLVGVEDYEARINQEIYLKIPIEKSDGTKSVISDRFVIVGIIDSGAGSEVFLPSYFYSNAGLENYNNFKVVVSDISNVSLVRARIEGSGLQTTSLADTMSEIDNIFKFLNVVLIGFGSIGMVVAVLGMFNTLTISLIERTKEIGLMMALGARQTDMKKLFTLDATIISFTGAVIGVLIAIILGRIVNLIINIGASNRGVTEPFEVFYVSFWSILLAIFITVVIGLLVVHYPAKRAEKINPIDALRRE